MTIDLSKFYSKFSNGRIIIIISVIYQIDCYKIVNQITISIILAIAYQKQFIRYVSNKNVNTSYTTVQYYYFPSQILNLNFYNH